MATKIAAPKSTGGGGFVFEEDVCAWLLAAMLVGEPVLGVDSGPPIRLDFQTRPDGWFLDDVLVTTSSGSVRNRFAFSIKSNSQFTAQSAPSDFVATVWEQWLHKGSTVFKPALDFMGLVTDPLSAAAESALTGLMEKATVSDPDLFPSRLKATKWASAPERALFASFACPTTVGQRPAEETARLLKRLRFLHLDFGAQGSKSENSALELCRRAVRSHLSSDAQDLWRRLREIAKELRPRAGSLCLSGLIARLSSSVMLADYPDHAGDWARLDARSAREAGLVRDSIADCVRLSRDEQLTGAVETLKTHSYVVLLGNSGVGKSALAKAIFDGRCKTGGRTFWIDAASVDRAADVGEFEASLQLRYPLTELLAGTTSRDPVIILDGLDRLYSEHAFRNVALLLQAVSGPPPATKWLVLVTCQAQEWPRVIEALQRAGTAVAPRWHSHEVEPLRPEDLQPICDSFPRLGRLLIQPHVGLLLTNLKLLDLVARHLERGAHIETSAWIGESSIAEWFWSAEVERGAKSLARGQFVRGLALRQADQLAGAVSIDDFEASALEPAQSLCADQLLVQEGDRLAFAHDLYGDWVRLRILINHRNDLSAFLRERYESPLWHRAIRLFGIHLLEREHGVSGWKEMLSTFARSEMPLVRDLLLEAPAFAMNAGSLLDRVFPDLVTGDGTLLRRLLTRFLAFATVPVKGNLEMARGVGVDDNVARAIFRRPHWPYWLDVLAVLHAHREEALNAAAFEVAKLVEMWLGWVPAGAILRSEAAELAVLLGQKAVDSRSDHDGKAERRRYYQCALLAAADRPDDVARIAKTAAERIPSERILAVAATPKQRRPRNVVDPCETPGPWPDGPLTTVDDEFQTVVLDHWSIREFIRARPADAREVILAALIEPPNSERKGSNYLREDALGFVRRRNWHPPLFTLGPFLTFLLENFDEGLELITKVLDFATARVSVRRQENYALDLSETEGEQLRPKHLPKRLFLLDAAGSVLTFSGDATVYQWSAGFGSAPAAIKVALMALEQYFYLRLDAGEDIAEQVAAVFSRSHSVATLGVLCDIGKRQPSLFSGPLMALLSAPEIYIWDLGKTGQVRDLIRTGPNSQDKNFVELAQRFHALEHRRKDLWQLAVECMFNSEDMQKFFCSIRVWWDRRHEEGEQLPEIVENLALSFNLDCYEKRTDPKYGEVIVNFAIERVRALRSNEIQANDDRNLLVIFPSQCKRILAGRHLQSEQKLEEFWRGWIRVREIFKARRVDGYFLDGCGNAFIGGIAVLLWHKDWLARHINRREEVECEFLALLKGEPPGLDGFAAHDESKSTWTCFLAESAAVLWTQEPQNSVWRRLVGQIASAGNHEAVRLLFLRCAEHRSTLGDDFERLRRLVIDWAHMQGRVSVLYSPALATRGDTTVQKRLQNELEAWVEDRLTSFVDGRLAPLASDWNRFEHASRFAEIDSLRGPWSSYAKMDFHLVRCSHLWLPLPDDAINMEERAATIQFWRVALDVVTDGPLFDLQEPEDDEEWVLENVASALLQMRPSENPELFWGRIIELHGEAYAWPETFLNALHQGALSAELPPETYPTLIRQIAQRAFSEVNGARRWRCSADVWDALIGINWQVSELWSSRHAQLVEANWDIITTWMEKVPHTSRRLSAFAAWLAKPSAVVVRTRALGWLLEVLKAGDGRSLDRVEDIEDNLAKLLDVVWDQIQKQPSALNQAGLAVRGLLAWLVERQNPLGLELQGRVGRLV